MLSMTQSTESKEKKETWGNQVHAQGWGPQRCPLPRVGPSFTDIHAWQAQTAQPVRFSRASVGLPSGAGHLPPGGLQTLNTYH